MQFNHDEWMKMANQFRNEITDTLLETALLRLPTESTRSDMKYYYKELKERREDIPRAMNEYYRFINKIADIKLSDKNEWVSVQEADGSLQVTVRKINKNGEIKGELMNKTFDPRLTKEIRIYTGDGERQRIH